MVFLVGTLSAHAASISNRITSGGRVNVLPGIIMFAMLGAAGQSLYNVADARHQQRAVAGVDSENKKSAWLDSKWSPVKVLSDEDYGKMLQEQLLRVDAEMSLLDERINVLRMQRTTEASLKDRPIGKIR